MSNKENDNDSLDTVEALKENLKVPESKLDKSFLNANEILEKALELNNSTKVHEFLSKQESTLRRIINSISKIESNIEKQGQNFFAEETLNMPFSIVIQESTIGNTKTSLVEITNPEIIRTISNIIHGYVVDRLGECKEQIVDK